MGLGLSWGGKQGVQGSGWLLGLLEWGYLGFERFPWLPVLRRWREAVQGRGSWGEGAVTVGLHQGKGWW